MSQQSRRELVDEVLRLVGETGDPTARALAEDLINTGTLRLWMKHPWRLFRMPTAYVFTTVANQRSYPLPHYFGRVLPPPAEIRNLTTGGILSFEDQDGVLSEFPTQGTRLEVAGVSSRAFISGSVGVGLQPTTAAGDALEVLSSSPSDTAVVVTIEGIDDNDRHNRTQVTLNGTSPVAVGTWKKVIGYSKACPDSMTPTTALASSVGSVTLRVVSGAVELQVLLPTEAAVDRPEITLHPKPSATWTIAVPMMRLPRRMVYDGDMVPSLWGPALREYMVRNWRVSTGELGEEGGAPYPALLDLIALDNVTGGSVPGRGRGSRSRY